MKTENRWVYVAGVAVLAILVVLGVIWGGGQDEASDASPPEGGARDAATDEGQVPDAAVDAVANDEPIELMTESAADAAPIPESADDCRAYCERLESDGQLANGMTLESCISQLCAPTEEGEEAPEPQEEPQEEAEAPETSDDCREQCQIYQRRGELRAGTTIEDCYTAMCSSEEETDEE